MPVRPLPSQLPITPFRAPVQGSVALPGSKSITNRALILAALSDRRVVLRGALFSRDTRIMVAALRQLGFAVETDESALTIAITGRGGEIPVRETSIHVGNAGTAARFLTAFVCLRPDGVYHFDGDEAMRRRPISALLEALEAQGAQASARAFPFTLRTAGLPGGTVELDASESSQMLSALLMVAPHARTPLTVRLKGAAGSKPFVAMTEKMLADFPAESRSDSYQIEPDASAASYFLALPAVTGGELAFPALCPPGKGLQGDTAFQNVLARLGFKTSHDSAGVRVHVARGKTFAGPTENFREFSDTFLTLAALAPLLQGPTRISGIAHTRKQETDRVAGMARELTKLGQHVIETEDALEIHPRPLHPGVTIETYHDHRFAMSFAILGCHDLQSDGRPWLTIDDPACCSKTFPDFFEVLENLRAPKRGATVELTMDFIVIAVDGGAASGKSSTSKILAERFNLLHVDTGSFYRHLTAELLRRGVPSTDLAGLKSALEKIQFSTRVNGRSAQMLVDGQPAGDEIRGAQVNEHVSHYAAIPEVRQALLTYQREQKNVARTSGFRGLIMEGRDIGSVIFPDADFRFFLHADPVEREKRRAAEGRTDSIAKRDQLDSSRKAAPLTRPPGAIDIDSTHLTLEQVVDQMAGDIKERLA